MMSFLAKSVSPYKLTKVHHKYEKKEAYFTEKMLKFLQLWIFPKSFEITYPLFFAIFFLTKTAFFLLPITAIFFILSSDTKIELSGQLDLKTLIVWLDCLVSIETFVFLVILTILYEIIYHTKTFQQLTISQFEMFACFNSIFNLKTFLKSYSERIIYENLDLKRKELSLLDVLEKKFSVRTSRLQEWDFVDLQILLNLFYLSMFEFDFLDEKNQTKDWSIDFKNYRENLKQNLLVFKMLWLNFVTLLLITTGYSFLWFGTNFGHITLLNIILIIICIIALKITCLVTKRNWELAKNLRSDFRLLKNIYNYIDYKKNQKIEIKNNEVYKNLLQTKWYMYVCLPLVQVFIVMYLCFKEFNDPIVTYFVNLKSYNGSLLVIDWLSWPFLLLTVIIIYTVLFLFYHRPETITANSEKWLLDGKHKSPLLNLKWSDSVSIINLNILLLFLVFAFTTNDLLLFYFMFESTLIPMFFLLGFFGSRTRKIRAAYSFFLYTMVGSVALLIAIFQIILMYKTTAFDLLINYNDLSNLPNYVWWCLFWGFGVKVPIMPFHNWLAEAHVEAPTVGSVILAALLLKLGGYGIIRILFLMFPTLSILNAPYAIAINTLSFFYASCMALRQFDFKRIIAYSSIAHMNFALIGLFSFTIEAVQGAIFLMVAHGLVSAGLFIGVGLLYELIATRLIITFSGLKRVWPVTSFLFLIFILANFGFPLTPNFVGELLIIIGGAHQILTVMTLVTVGTILTLVYSLVLYSKMFLGSLRPHIENWNSYFLQPNMFNEISEPRNFIVLNYNIVLRILLIFCIIIALYPTIILQMTNDFVVWFILQKYCTL